MQFFVWFGKEFQRVEAATANDCPPLVFKLNACFARGFWLQKHRSLRLIFFRKSMMSMVQCKPWGAWKVMKKTGYAVQLATSEHSMKSGVTCSVLKMKKWSPQWTQFMQLHEEAWKKFRNSMGFERVTSRYRCDALPTELWSHYQWKSTLFQWFYWWICISVRELDYFLKWSSWVQGNSNGPLVPMVRLVPMEKHPIPMVLLVNMHLIKET